MKLSDNEISIEASIDAVKKISEVLGQQDEETLLDAARRTVRERGTFERERDVARSEVQRLDRALSEVIAESKRRQETILRLVNELGDTKRALVTAVLRLTRPEKEDET